jgi:hypothetical protein
MVSQEFMEEAHIWWDITYAGKNGNLSWEEMNIAKRVNAINAYSERILSDEEFLSVGEHPKNFWEWTDDEQRKWNLTELKKKWQKEATDFIFQTKEWKANDPVQGHSTINPRGSLPTGFTFSENDLEKWRKQESENKKKAQAAQERMRDQRRREKELEDEMMENKKHSTLPKRR